MKNNDSKIINMFIDFETNGLYGEITDFAIVNEGNYVINFSKEGNNDDENSKEYKFIQVADDHGRKYVNEEYEYDKPETIENAIFVAINEIYSKLNKDDQKVHFYVWHHWQLTYLYKYLPDVFNLMHGRIFDIIPIANFMIGKTRIQDITKELTGHNHNGIAFPDAVDLMECYDELVKMKGE